MGSPFHCDTELANLDRFRSREERDDYIGVKRVMHHCLTKAMQTLQSSDDLRAEKEKADALNEQPTGYFQNSQI